MMTRGRFAVRLLLSVIVILTILVAGCGKKKIEDPYEKVSLAGAVSGESLNKLFKFELFEPQVLSVVGKLALLAEEDRIEFLFADDLALLSTLDAGFKLGVRREFGDRPEVYLVLEHVIDGPDTSFVTADEIPVFPSFQEFSEFNASAYKNLDEELSGMSESDVEKMVKAIGRQGTKVTLTGTLARAEIMERMSYVIDTPQGRFLLESVTPQGELFLKAFMKSGGDFTCAGSLGKLFRGREQRETGVDGPLTLEYFRFQDFMLTNG